MVWFVGKRTEVEARSSRSQAGLKRWMSIAAGALGVLVRSVFSGLRGKKDGVDGTKESLRRRTMIDDFVGKWTVLGWGCEGVPSETGRLCLAVRSVIF